MHSRKANLTPWKIPWTLMESFFCVISFLAHALRELYTIHSLLAIITLAESLPMSSAQDDDSWPYPRTFHLYSFPSCAQCALLSAVLCTVSEERSWCASACIQHSSRNREQLEFSWWLTWEALGGCEPWHCLVRWGQKKGCLTVNKLLY